MSRPRKLLAICITVILVFTLVGCGASQPTASQAMPTSTPTPVPSQDTASNDIEYLKVINEISYNSLAEGKNIIDEIARVGSLQESTDELAVNMDIENGFWDNLITKVNATNPKDSLLIITHKELIDDLNKIKSSVGGIQGAAKAKNTIKITSTLQDFTLALNHIKVDYNKPMSQMKKFGITPKLALN